MIGLLGLRVPRVEPRVAPPAPRVPVLAGLPPGLRRGRPRPRRTGAAGVDVDTGAPAMDGEDGVVAGEAAVLAGAGDETVTAGDGTGEEAADTADMGIPGEEAPDGELEISPMMEATPADSANKDTWSSRQITKPLKLGSGRTYSQPETYQCGPCQHLSESLLAVLAARLELIYVELRK